MIDDRAQTVLRRSFEAPIEKVFLAWTDATILPVWWGPRDVTVPECHFDLRQDGPYRIVMQAGDGTPTRWLARCTTSSCPRATPWWSTSPSTLSSGSTSSGPGVRTSTTLRCKWRYEVSFFDGGDSTTVEVRATYPVLDDRDALVRVGGERGGAESFSKLDTLLA